MSGLEITACKYFVVSVHTVMYVQINQ